MAAVTGAQGFVRRNWLLLLWAVGALIFAVSRVPYDDEWFSLTLAADTDWEHFLASLRSDFHPPYVALLDRALVALGAGRLGIHGSRILAVAAGILLLRSVLEERTDLRAPWILLSAFHPVIFYYAGAARWYPFLFLAQALRCWALFGPATGTRRASAAFVLGAAIGPAAGYLDLWFVLVDSVWLVTTARRLGRLLRGVGVGVAALAAAVFVVAPFSAPFVLSAQASHHIAFSEFPRSTGTWSILGLVGEAHPPFPWLGLAALAVPGLFLGIARLLRRGASRSFAAWLIAVALSWSAGTFVIIRHPRYSLLLWVVAAASLGGVWSGPRLWKLAAALSVAYLAVGLGLALAGIGFVKGDLNAISTDHCADLFPEQADVAIVPYPRAAVFLDRCEGAPPIVTARMSRHFPSEAEQMAPLRARVQQANRIILITLVRPSGSLWLTQRRTSAMIAERCDRRWTRQAMPDVHGRLRAHFDPQRSRLRYSSELWLCDIDR